MRTQYIFTKLLGNVALVAVVVLGASATFAQSPSPYEIRFPYAGLVPPAATAPTEAPDTGGAGGGSGSPGDMEEPESAVVPVSLSLAGAALPYAMVGKAYNFDFGALLTIEGDNAPALSAVYWPEVAELPPGLTLTDTGVLTGTPTTQNESGTSFEVVAQHEDAEGRQTFTIVVNGVGLQVAQVSSSYTHTCAVTPAGAAVCWGQNSKGELGDGSTTARNYPVAVQGLGSGVAQVSAGDKFTCAVTTAGMAYCWGFAADGRFGDGATLDRSVPGPAIPALGSTVASIAAGDRRACALSTAGAVTCWGLGFGATPTAVSGFEAGVTQIAVERNVCAVQNGAAKCLGANSYGQLGNGNTTTSSTPVQVSGLENGVSQVTLGDQHGCAIHNGAAKCWGYGEQGNLGNGSNSNRTTPVNVQGLESGVSHIASGASHTCAVHNGAVKCWGWNASYQLGDGSTSNRNSPVSTPGLSSGVTRVATGYSHTCGVHLGVVKCWGGGEAVGTYAHSNASATPINPPAPAGM